jgi:uncharacterized protein (TIGR03437 family)
MMIQAISEHGLEIDRAILAPPPVLFSYEVAGNQIRLFGMQLATSDVMVPMEPLPTEIARTFVLFGGQPLPLHFVSSSEIVARLPYAPYPGARVSVVTPNGTAELSL